MATLSYNGVDFDNILTLSMREEAVTDDSGLDYECTRIVLAVRATVNPQWLSTNKANPGRGPASAGDRAGIFLYNVRKKLSEPRGRLVYVIGEDPVIESPARHGDPDEAESHYGSDIRGGPFTSGVSVTEVVGDKSLIAEFTVETYVSADLSNNMLLSNRWDWACDRDEFGYATVTISGKAVLRKDMLDKAGLSPSDFRDVIIPPPGKQMHRSAVHTSVDPGGMKLTYRVTDKSVNYGMKLKEIARMECIAVSGLTGGNGSISGTFNSFVDMGKGAAGMQSKDPMSVLSGANTFLQGISSFITNVCPRQSICITARAYGMQGSNRQTLYNACQQLAFSRLADCVQGGNGVFGRSPWMTSFRASFNFDTHSPPMAEFSVEFCTTLSYFSKFNINPLSSNFGVRTYAMSDAATDSVPPGINTAPLSDITALAGFGIKAATLSPISIEKVDGKDVISLEGGSKFQGPTATPTPGTNVRVNNTPATCNRAVRVGRAFSQALAFAGLNADSRPDAPQKEIDFTTDATVAATNPAINDRTTRTDGEKNAQNFE